MKRCIIFGAAPINPSLLILPSLEDDDFIIAADGGLHNASLLSVVPDLILGDMDSLQSEKVPEGAILFPVRKDDTDLMLAVRKGIELKYNQFLIYGALGGRLDHTFASIQTLAFLLDHNCRGALIDENHWVTMIENESIMLPKSYKYVSIFSFSDKSTGVTLKGLGYLLNDGELSQSFPLGVSNYIDSNSIESTVSVKNGRILIILSNLT